MPIFRPSPAETPIEGDVVPTAALSESSPTWELELLLSGLVLFALFQLPDVLNSFFDHLAPHATASVLQAVFFVQLYSKAIVYALMVAFVLHLVSRAYWVGLVGLHSVYPGGVKWNEAGTGPITTQVYRERLVSLPTVIAKTDNFCSVIFSVACLIVILFLFSVMLSGAFVVISYGGLRLTGRSRGVANAFFVLVAIFVVVALGTAVVDKRYGTRFAPGGWAQHIVRRTATFMYYAGVLSVTGPIFLTLTTNVGRKKMVAIVYTALMLILAAASAERLARDPPVPDSLAIPALRCLAAIHTVALNGARLDSIDFNFYQQPESGIEGILAYIPAEGLPRGRNVITVTQTPRFDADAPKNPLTTWVIPFWR